MPDMWMDVDTALAEVPVNILPLTDDTDFKSREESVAYNAAGMELIWHFTTTAGATTATVVTPTTGGAYDWAHQDGGMYTIEIPASGGASINNDTEGFGHFTGVATGVLPWRGPVIGFRAAGINNALIDGAWSATRGLGGPTALPDAAADAPGGLPISDAGGLDLDTYIKRLEAAFTSTIAGYIDAAISTRAPETGGNLADVKTAVGAAGAGLTAITGAKLHADYDAAKTAASQTSVNDLPTNGELATALAAADDEVLAELANATYGLSALETLVDGLESTIGVAGAGLTALGDTRLANLDAAITSRSTYAGADTAGTTTLLTRLTALRAGYLDLLNAYLDAAVSTRSGHNAADVKTAVEAAGSHLTLIKAETDKLADTLEDDGGTYRFTENALEQAPSGTSTGATLSEIEGSTVLAKEATLTDVGADVDAIDAKVSALGASVVTVTSPVSVDAETVTLVCGDDYYNADGRALTFTDAGGTYPAFTAGTCKFTVRDLATGTDTETAGTIVDANTVRFELTKTATGAWTAGGKYRFDVEVTLASGHEVTIATGTVVMLAKYSG